jgi:sugar lactone lactonase YvrE
MKIDVLLRPETSELRFLPEGPYPLGPDRFSWVAIQHGSSANFGSLNIYDAKKKASTSFRLPGRPGFAFPTDVEGVFVVGCERSVGLFDTARGTWQDIAGGIDHDCENTIINDGVTWDGNLVFGCKDLEFKTKKAGLYLYRGSDGALIRLRNDQICSNGKVIIESDEGLELLDIDSPTRTVVAYRLDLKARTLSAPRVVLNLTSDPAVPDGMIATPDGKSLIIAMFNPNPAPHGETRQYSIADGALEQVWELEGSPQNTCPQLVEMNKRVHLVVTTAVEHMTSEQQAAAPNAGCIFATETDWKSPSFSPVFRLSDSLKSKVAG